MAYKASGLLFWNLGAEENTRHQVAGADVVRLKVGRTSLGVPHHTFDFEGPRDPNAMVQELEAKGILAGTGSSSPPTRRSAEATR